MTSEDLTYNAAVRTKEKKIYSKNVDRYILRKSNAALLLHGISDKYRLCQKHTITNNTVTAKKEIGSIK
jgi:hypothetical protein